jgi:hypothetical protein
MKILNLVPSWNTGTPGGRITPNLVACWVALLNSILGAFTAFLRTDLNALRGAIHQAPYTGILSPWASEGFAVLWLYVAITSLAADIQKGAR